jgi:hypothetical protein
MGYSPDQTYQASPRVDKTSPERVRRGRKRVSEAESVPLCEKI